MKVMPIRYVRDLAAATRFYAALGLSVDARQRSGVWMELAAGGGVLALHEADHGEPAVELAFVTEEPLEKVRARLAGAGFEAEVVDEAFGRSLRTTDPEGLRLQVNEHDPELYT
jgi:catechol 2,3-dioxygenase-like lactoylglutathione lyase family enzyme